MAAAYLAKLEAGEAVSEAARTLTRSSAAMQELLNDLTDFNRTNLGLGLKLARSEVDLSGITGHELDLLRSAYPGRQITFASSGDTRGLWDGFRVRQIVRNLVSNAIAYGSRDAPVEVTLRGDASEARLDVSNRGHMEELHTIFEPLNRGAGRARNKAPEGLGLGLFIVREIARAHGGDV